MLQAHVQKFTTGHISILFTIMITTSPSIQQPSDKSVTTLESSAGHWTVLFKLFLIQYDILQNWVLVKSEWKKYKNRNNGRHDFQINLAISMINFAIVLECNWDSKYPGWIL